MALLSVDHVALRGMAVAVPSTCDFTESTYPWSGCDDFIRTTGILSRRRASKEQTASDLCFSAADKLLDELGWNRDEVEMLAFVTQTPDYIVPSTTPLLQHRLGLSKECYTLEISLGCSGWVYGLSVIASLMQGGGVKKGLLLTGDTFLKFCSPEDKSTYPLFGDAGSATALIYSPEAKSMKFHLGSDGGGFKDLMIREGGYRHPVSAASLERHLLGEGIVRSEHELRIDGMNVFSFTIEQVPRSIHALAGHYALNLEDVDLFTFHQANRFLNESIRKKLKIPAEKVAYSLDEFGNTGCASIPLTYVLRHRDRLMHEHLSHIACGFGVGLSWGSVWFETEQMVVPPLIEI